jgi:hypothetical protein
LAASHVRCQPHLQSAETVERTWLPTCRTPERLWNVYTDVEAAQRRMVESAVEAARADLRALGITLGLPVTQFNRHVAAILGQMPLVQEMDAASRLPEGVDREHGGSSYRSSFG